MKTQVKTRLRWGAAGAFGLMLTLNVMVGLDFEKGKMMPTLTLVELGNRVQAQSESESENVNECANWFWDCDALWREKITNRNCEAEYSYSLGVISMTETYFGKVVECIDGPNFICNSGCNNYSPYTDR